MCIRDRNPGSEQRPYGPGYYPYPYEDEIDLREYIGILWKWRTVIVSVTLLSVLAAGLVSFFVLKPVYEASTQILTSRDSMPVSYTHLDVYKRQHHMS